MNTIHQIAKKNGYPITIIENLNKQIINKNLNKTQNNSQTKQNNKKWVTFKYHSLIIRKVTNIFRNTNLQITYQVRNTTQNLLKTHKKNPDIYTNSGIYSLRCNSCNMQYIGQTGRSLKARYIELEHRIRT
jgi:hypothetical protein